jgi:hypothetical protein
MSASEQLTATRDVETLAPLAIDAAHEADETGRPVAATAHVGTRQSSDSFLTILPDDAHQGAPRGARRQTWRR